MIFIIFSLQIRFGVISCVLIVTQRLLVWPGSCFLLFGHQHQHMTFGTLPIQSKDMRWHSFNFSSILKQETCYGIGIVVVAIKVWIISYICVPRFLCVSGCPLWDGGRTHPCYTWERKRSIDCLFRSCALSVRNTILNCVFSYMDSFYTNKDPNNAIHLGKVKRRSSIYMQAW